MDLVALLKSLVALPHETEWVEYKHNNDNPQEIGEYISAIANSAKLHDCEYGYIIWGVEDGAHNLVGTTFHPHLAKKGNHELEHWLSGLLRPSVHFEILEQDYQDSHFVIFKIPAAQHTPVRFGDAEFIRIGSVKTRLKEHPEKERELWRKLNQYEFETEIVLDGLDRDEIENFLSLASYYELIRQPMPSIDEVIETFIREKLIISRIGGAFAITNMGAILLAHDLHTFAKLKRKSVRLVEYKGTGRIETKQEIEDARGYAVAFVDIVNRLKQLLPVNEVIESSLRKQVPVYPEIALRELVANALIHQDFSVSGAGPMVEIFGDRIEFSNPGEPLVDTQRFIDARQSRNDLLASLMRLLNICEERGSGIDKVITYVEFFQLPAPNFEKANGFTKATLYAPIPFKDMDKSDRIRACYQHTCLMYVSNQRTTNASVRQRFGLPENGVNLATRIIRDTIEAEKIKPKADDAGGVGRRYVEYLPFWA